MKCRYTTNVDLNSTTSINVTTNRSGVISLGVSLSHDDRVNLFAICVEFTDNPESYFWVTLWTRESVTDDQIRMNPDLFYVYNRMCQLDRKVVADVIQYVTRGFVNGAYLGDPFSP